jgi:hypothetical protein
MATPAITPRPGFYGRLSYPGNGQRIKVGPWLDMADPVKAWRTALDVQYQHEHRELILEVVPVRNSKVRSVQTIVLKDFINNDLAGLDAGQATTHPDAMQPLSPYASEPAPQVQIMRPPQAQTPPPNMDHMGQFLFNQQEQRLLDSRTEAWNLQQALRNAEGDKTRLQEELNKKTLELQFKDREHLHDLLDREREIRDKYEGQQPKPSGLAGLSEVLTNAQHPMAPLLMGLAAKFLGPVAGAPGAPNAPASGPQLTGTYSPIVVEALDAIGPLLTSDQMAAHVYTSLATILSRENGLLQLQQLAGLQATV